MKTESIFEVGEGTYISPKAKIVALDGISKPKRFIIGDMSYIGDDVQILCDDVVIGDYCKIHHHSNIHGYLPFSLGHNAWIGQYTIMDCIGGIAIGNNFCLSAQSQLWTHFKFGDCLEGCRFNLSKSMSIGNDVWIGVQSIVTPINAEDKSLLMGGSLMTKNMQHNRVYAGSPAIDITEKIGPQFSNVSISDKMDTMNRLHMEFGSPKDIRIIETIEQIGNENISYFAVDTRQYKKTLSSNEVAFMKYLLPTKAKFTPII